MNIKNIEKELNDITFMHYYSNLKMLAKTVFKWNNLPNGIDEKWIEDYLFSEGRCVFFKDDTFGFMVAKCAEGGTLNAYNEPTLLRPIATNYDGCGKSYENNETCILIRNNDECLPTAGEVKFYAYQLTNISRTIDINIHAMKTPVLITCNEKQRVTLKNVYSQWNGFEPVIFGSKDLDMQGVNVLKTDAPIVFDKLQIEKNHIWNECMTMLGINNCNMDKRERLVDDEVQANNEQVELFALSLLKARETACEHINKLFGTNISVEFRNAYKANLSEFEGGEDDDSEVHD